MVFATSPKDPTYPVCKRVIGTEGDLIEVEPRSGDRRDPVDEISDGMGDRHGDLDGDRRKGEGEWLRIPKGHVWLAGDNLSNSTDSRTYGPVPLALVKGKVLVRVSNSG